MQISSKRAKSSVWMGNLQFKKKGNQMEGLMKCCEKNNENEMIKLKK